MAIQPNLTGPGGVRGTPAAAPVRPGEVSGVGDRYEGSRPAVLPSRPGALPASAEPALGPGVFRDPARWEALQSRRRQLGEAQEGSHVRLLEHDKQVAQDLESRIQEVRGQAQQQFDQIASQQLQVESDWKAQQKEFQGGWKAQKAAQSAQFERTFQAQAAIDAAFPARDGKSTSGQISRLRELDKMIADPKWKGNRETLEQVRREVSGDLSGRGVHLPSAKELENPPKGNKGLVARWFGEENKLKQADNFPRTKKDQQSWLEARGRERDQALTELQSRAGQVQAGLSAREKTLREQAQSSRSQEKQALIQELSAEVGQLSQVKSDELRPEVLKSQAFARVSPENLKIEGNRLVGKSESGTVTLHRDPQGTLVAESTSPKETALSKIVSAPDGSWTEQSKVQSVPPGTMEETSRRGSDGRESRSRLERSGVNEKRTTQEFKDGLETSSSLQVLENGRTVRSEDRQISRSEGRVETSIRREEGGRKSQSREVVHADGLKTRQETTQDGLRTVVRQNLERPDGTSQGSESTTTRRENGEVVISTIDRKNGREIGRVEEKTGPITADPDVEGLGWIGSHNPQDLVERLGDEGSLRAERTVRQVTADGKTTSTEMIRLKSGDGQRDLLETKNPHGSSVWEYRQKHDGRWDSQIFFQGSSDTITTKNSQEAGWMVERTHQDLSSMDPAKRSEIANLTERTTRSREDARLSDVRQALSSTRPPLNSIEKSEGFRRFTELAGEGPFKVVVADSQERFANGKAMDNAHLVVEGPNGLRLVVQADPDTGSVASQVENGKSPELGSLRSVVTAQGERYEVTPDGNAFRITVDGKVSVLEGEEWKKADARYIGKSVGTALKTIPPNLKTPGGLWRASAGLNFGKIFTGLGALSMGADLLAGDFERAGRRAADLGVGSAALIQKAEAVALAKGSSLGGGAWMARAGKTLGAAGVLGGGAFAIYDLAQGEYTHATLGAVATGGSALALWGTASWAGPVGWGAAALATAGTLAYDYNESTRVADFQLPE